MVCDRPEVAGAKALTHSGHFGVSSRLPFLSFKTENHILSTLNPWLSAQSWGHPWPMWLYNTFWVLQTEMRKCTRSPLKTYTDIPQYRNLHYSNTWMILQVFRLVPHIPKSGITLWNSGTIWIWIIRYPMLSKLASLQLAVRTQFTLFEPQPYFMFPSLSHTSNLNGYIIS